MRWRQKLFPAAFLGSPRELQLPSESQALPGALLPTDGRDTSAPRCVHQQCRGNGKRRRADPPRQSSLATVDNQCVNIIEMFQGCNMFPWVSLFPSQVSMWSLFAQRFLLYVRSLLERATGQIEYLMPGDSEFSKSFYQCFIFITTTNKWELDHLGNGLPICLPGYLLASPSPVL